MTCLVAKYCSKLSSFSDAKIQAALAKHQLHPQVFCKKQQPLAGNEEERSNSKERLPSTNTALPESTRTLGTPEPWWGGELAESIHNTLRGRESMLDTLKLASPQLPKRCVLLLFIFPETNPLLPHKKKLLGKKYHHRNTYVILASCC